MFKHARGQNFHSQGSIGGGMTVGGVSLPEEDNKEEVSYYQREIVQSAAQGLDSKSNWQLGQAVVWPGSAWGLAGQTR
jgi:hypothetical protein